MRALFLQLIGNVQGCTVISADFITGLSDANNFNGDNTSYEDPTEDLKVRVQNALLATPPPQHRSKRSESWKLLASNTFDSTRKRMSVLMRAPPELGSVYMLFVKGADSSMLVPSVAVGGDWLLQDDRSRDADKEVRQFSSLFLLVLSSRFLTIFPFFKFPPFSLPPRASTPTT